MINQLKIGDKIMIVLVIIASFSLFFYFRLGNLSGEGQQVVIEANGQVVHTVSLPQENYEWKYVAEDGDYNLIQVQGHQVRIVEASCPDQVCTNEGWKSRPGSTIVCLPHKLIVKIVGGEEENEYDLDGTTF